MESLGGKEFHSQMAWNVWGHLCNSGITVGGGAECSPDTSHQENFCWPTWKRETRKKGKMEKKEGKSKKGRWKIANGRRKSYKMRSLLFTFQNHQNLFWVYQNGNFLPGKKIRKNDFVPSEKYTSYALLCKIVMKNWPVSSLVIIIEHLLTFKNKKIPKLI